MERDGVAGNADSVSPSNSAPQPVDDTSGEGVRGSIHAGWQAATQDATRRRTSAAILSYARTSSHSRRKTLEPKATAEAPHAKYAPMVSAVTPPTAISSMSANGPLISRRYVGPKTPAGKTFTMVAPAAH